MNIAKNLWVLLLVAFSMVLLSSGCKSTSYLGRAQNQISYLKHVKEHGLMIRLKSDEARIATLRKYGKNEQADRREEEIRSYNNNLKTAIRESYDFSEVYYYYSKDANAIIKQGDHTAVMDQDLSALDAPFTALPGVLLTTEKRPCLHMWEDSKLIRLDKLNYPKPGVGRGWFSSALNYFSRAFKDVHPTEIAISMNEHFHYGYNQLRGGG